MRGLDQPVVLTGERTDRLLRCYQAEPGDGWSGYLVAPRGWNGNLPLPSPPASTERLAAVLWFRLQARLLDATPSHTAAPGVEVDVEMSPPSSAK